MAKRMFNDNFWGDDFVQTLEKDAKFLFAYLWTNKRCNSAGLYEITLKTISFETDIPAADLPRLFDILKSRVRWIPDKNIVWVVNFLKHQPKSDMFLRGVASCLEESNSNGLVKEFLNYYGQLGVSIPYGDGSKTVSRPSAYVPTSTYNIDEEYYEDNNVTTGVVKGAKAQANKLLAEDKKTTFDDYVLQVVDEFSDLDIQEELKKFKLYWSEGKRELKRPKVAFHNWLVNARKFKTEHISGSQGHSYETMQNKFANQKNSHMVQR